MRLGDSGMGRTTDQRTALDERLGSAPGPVHHGRLKGGETPALTPGQEGSHGPEWGVLLSVGSFIVSASGWLIKSATGGYRRPLTGRPRQQAASRSTAWMPTARRVSPVHGVQPPPRVHLLDVTSATGSIRERDTWARRNATGVRSSALA